MNQFNGKLVLATALVAAAGAFVPASARPTVETGNERRAQLLKTAAGCRDPQATIDLDINNVRARIMTGGDMWWDRGTGEARYEIPKGSRKNSLFAGALWVGGFDTQGQLKVTAQTFRNGANDYWAGPLDANNTINEDQCNLWDRFWKVNAADVTLFRALVSAGQEPTGAQYEDIKQWPARGNLDAKGSDGVTALDQLLQYNRSYASFVDVDGDGIYEWREGDYPSIDVNDDCGITPNGGPDQYIFSIFNDVGNTKTQTGSDAIGLEVQRTVFAYSTKDFLNDASFINYRLINRGSLTLDSCYTATWTDADLGNAFDDYIGCDTGRGLGILYNARTQDGNGEPVSYGTQIPMVGVDFFIGPKRFFRDSLGRDTFEKLKMSNFTYFTNGGNPEIRDPGNAIEFFRYMTGSNRLGQPFTRDFTGARTQTFGYGSGPRYNYVFDGDPGLTGTWSECFTNNTPGDRRFVHSAGPYRLTGGGVTNDITIGVCWVANVGGCPNTNFSKIKAADDAIQDLFDNCFRTIEGPEAPNLTIREMNRQLIFYMTNDSFSNNYRERYGRDSSNQRYLVASTRSRSSADPFYKFEGYRVFQLRDQTIQPSQIFGEDGEVDEQVAVEVFQTDLRNGITQITNFTRRNDIVGGNTIYRPELKVTGKDSGIVHSFVLTQDAFASGQDKSFVNYRPYYFVAIAYAYNNFDTFDVNNDLTTQDLPYLESAKSSGGRPIEVKMAMPNPANGDMGTVLNAGYGDGVQITRIEGIGNGGNALEMTPESEAEVLANNIDREIVYQRGAGPIDVRVVDPLKIVEADWQLQITGPLQADPSRGIAPASGNWKLVRTNVAGSDTIYSERTLDATNEQILADYGLSITIGQVGRPGDARPDGSSVYGLITSSVTYDDNTKVWLWGVQDEEDESNRNWIRSGNQYVGTANPPTYCNFFDKELDTAQVFERLLDNNTLTRGTWAPYALAAAENRSSCGFGVAASDQVFGSKTTLDDLRSIDIVYTSDKSKWSRCMVVEHQDTTALSQGNVAKHFLRRHPGWNGDFNGNTPVYSTNPADSGMSYFPGYATDQETGERLNIFFGEDSWLQADNGADMLWNPTSNMFDAFGSPLFGGKHYVYVSRTRYDGCATLAANLRSNSQTVRRLPYLQTMWVGTPMLRPGAQMLAPSAGYIPTTTRLRFRVPRPYAAYVADSSRTPINNNLPVYNFSTRGMGPRALDANGRGTAGLLDSIYAVPNPYYGYSGYEQSRLDTRVRIIRLPRNATISIYSLDGSLIRRLTKDDPSVSYIDWDLRNARGLPIASGMYLIHVDAKGIGETVIKWFGAMRPVDITTF